MNTANLVSPNLIHTLPPVDRIMPQQGQMIAMVVFGAMALVLTLYAIYVAFTHRSWLPVLFLVGGLLNTAVEPISNVLGNIIHSPVGQVNAFTSEGHPIPWYACFAHIVLVAVIGVLFFRKYVERTMTAAFWWKTVIVYAAIFVCTVHFFLKAGLWFYYGNHGLKIGEVSLAMLSSNIAALVIAPLMVYRLMPILKGWKQLIVVPLLPCVTTAIHTGVHLPAYTVLGQDTATLPTWVLHTGNLMSFGLGIMMLWIFINLVHNRFPDVDTQ